MREMCISPVHIQGEIDLNKSIGGLLASSGQSVEDGSIVVVAQKIVSKSEGRVVRLDDVKPSVLARGIASEYGRDARVIELVMREAKRLVRMRDGLIITQTHHGLVCANSGVDESNAPVGCAVLLPEDPDASARRIRDEIKKECGADVGVIIADTFGRPFRLGQTNCAIGSAGIVPALDYAGRADSFGRKLRTTLIATVDELAGAAEIVMAKASQCPMALVRGAPFEISEGACGAASLIRDESKDLFI